jgi:hypothetical protein
MAIFHGLLTVHRQIEILMNALLLKVTVRNSLVLAGLWGLVLFTATLALPNISLVFMAASVFGGANDLVVVSDRSLLHESANLFRCFSWDMARSGFTH